MKKINNQFYNDLGAAWWDENNSIYLLNSLVNPWRVPYFIGVLQEYYADRIHQSTLLDIGCGGGYLTEAFARLGCQTTGIDLSQSSIQAARKHAESQELTIDYKVGSATALEFEDDSFDVLSCCDVLEHIEDWPAAVQEISRVLRPGGLFFFDTINRTIASYLTMIFGLEIFPLTRIFNPRTHIWNMFIKPGELSHELSKNYINVKEIKGGKMSANPIMAAYLLYRYNRVGSSFSDLGKSLKMAYSRDLSQNYLGYGQLELLPPIQSK